MNTSNAPAVNIPLPIEGFDIQKYEYVNVLVDGNKITLEFL